MTSTSEIGSEDERTAQLVVEVDVTDMARSVAFYERLGFAVARRTPDFTALKFGEAWLFLAKGAAEHGRTEANARVLVADVDAAWAIAQELGATVERPVGDRSYGLRDFTIRDPDGFCLRFASPLGR